VERVEVEQQVRKEKKQRRREERSKSSRAYSVYAIKRVVEVAVLPEAAGAKLEIVVAVRLPRPERPLRQLGRSTLPYPRRGAASPVHDKVANQL